MGAIKLDTLVADISGRPGLSINEQIEGNLRLTKDFVSELAKITDKCNSTRQIDGENVEIIGLTLTGKLSIEHVGLTYNCNNEVYFRTYTKQDFYNL
jgi:hypothetical protein